MRALAPQNQRGQLVDLRLGEAGAQPARGGLGVGGVHARTPLRRVAAAAAVLPSQRCDGATAHSISSEGNERGIPGIATPTKYASLCS